MNKKKIGKIYKLIGSIIIVLVMIKVKGQIAILKKYDSEIAVLNEKITTLKNEQNEIDEKILNNSKKDNENMARKDLKMYYPNETPYKGY